MYGKTVLRERFFLFIFAEKDLWKMDKTRLELAGALALNRIFGFEPKYSVRLIENLGSAAAVFSLSSDELRSIFGPCSKYSGSINTDALEKADREIDYLKSIGAVFVPLTSPDFPQLLKECEDAPAGLYVRSASTPAEIFNSRGKIAIVGTRDLSLYGKEWSERTVRAIACSPSRPSIVSGLALGVDISAHMAALACKLPTIAVLPVGIHSVYPASHRTAAGKIAEFPGGALVTDYPPGTPPNQLNFLRRNRIIAGMSSATILIESRLKGGGMMTARLAAGYGRTVLALPGRADDLRSQGCNQLLKEKVAEPLFPLTSLSADLGLESFNMRRSHGIEDAVRAHYSGLADTQTVTLLCRIAAEIKKNRGITPEGLSEAVALPYREAAAMVGMLESDGFVSTDLLQRCVINVRND